MVYNLITLTNHYLGIINNGLIDPHLSRRDPNHELHPSHLIETNQSAHNSLLQDHFDSLHVIQPNDLAAIIQRSCRILL